MRDQDKSRARNNAQHVWQLPRERVTGPRQPEGERDGLQLGKWGRLYGGAGVRAGPWRMESINWGQHVGKTEPKEKKYPEQK